jgi:predicted transcriptional regulator
MVSNVASGTGRVEMMKTISLRLEEEQYKRLRWLSYVEDKPMATLIRDAVDTYLKEQQRPRPGQEWFWAGSWQAAEHEVEAELADGDYETFDTMADFLKDLH